MGIGKIWSNVGCWLKKDFSSLLLLFFFGLFLVWPLFQEGYFASHERFFSYLRLRGIDSALASGQFPPQVFPHLINGFSYGYLIFYPPLSYEFGWLVFKATGLSIFESLKVVHFLSIFLSGLTMFYFVKDVSKNGTVAVLAAIFYMSAPYRIVDIYVRNAFGESFAYIFMPVIFHGVYKLMFGDRRSIWILAFGLSGHILAHNITAFYLGLFMLAFVLAYGKVFVKEHDRVTPLFKAGVLALVISAYYVFPFFEYVGSGRYGISNMPDVTELVALHALYPSQLLGSEFNQAGFSALLGSPLTEMPFMLGHHLAVFCVVSVLLFRKLAGSRLFVFSFICGIISVFMTTYWFPWNSMPGFMLYIQFPWRMLMFAVFFLSISSAYVFTLVRWNSSVVIMLVVFFLCLYVNPFLKKVDHIYVTDEMVSEPRDVPIKMMDYLWFGFASAKIGGFSSGYITNRQKVPLVLKGDSEISGFTRDGTNLSFSVKVGPQPALVELPLLYYDGYEAVMTTDDGEKELMFVYESPAGFCLLRFTENAEVKVRFKGTVITRISTILTLLGLAVLLVLIGRSFRESLTAPKPRSIC